MLGFTLDIWDYLTFLTMFLAVAALVLLWIWLAGLPGRIAIARKHPEAEAVRLLGYAGAHLGVQADRDRRHPALPARRSAGDRRRHRSAPRLDAPVVSTSTDRKR